MEVYNEAWGDNWGFVPITEAEAEFQAKNLKLVLDENWAMMAERDGEVVGAALTLPDINQVLAKMNGRLLPFGWWHFLRGKRKIDRLRVVRARRQARLPAHRRRRGALRSSTSRRRPRPGRRGGEMGWILETNGPMNRAMEGMGGTVVKRYRIYERAAAGLIKAHVPGFTLAADAVATHALARVGPGEREFDVDGEVLAEEDAAAGRRAAGPGARALPGARLARSCAARSAPRRSPPPAASSPAPRPSPRCGPSARSAPASAPAQRSRGARPSAPPTSSPAAPSLSTSTCSAAERPAAPARPLELEVAPPSPYRLPALRRRGRVMTVRDGVATRLLHGRGQPGPGPRLAARPPGRAARRGGRPAAPSRCRRRRRGAAPRRAARSSRSRSSGCASRSASTTTSASSTGASAATRCSGR